VRVSRATRATLIFRLVNNDADTTTTVRITDFELIESTLPAIPPGRTSRSLVTSTDTPPASSASSARVSDPAETADRRSPAQPSDSLVVAADLGSSSDPPPQTADGDSLLDATGQVTFTTTDDFLSGTLFNVNVTDFPDELRLNPPDEIQTFPFIWISNSAEGTVSRFDLGQRGQDPANWFRGPQWKWHRRHLARLER
jgi:hypothetical protein